MMSGERDITIRESSKTSSRVKTSPKSPAIPVPFAYAASDDGTDENLLILLHGLGDTHLPFAKLGRSLRLPQTATLALRAPEKIPFLYEEAYQWYTSFDPLGELLAQPNPTPALELIARVVEHLVRDCAWPPHRIHLFGFAQGGSVAAEFALRYWRTAQALHPKSFSSTMDSASSSAGLPWLGSVISISGPLLSYPTVQKQCPTPLLIFHRPAPADTAMPSDAVTGLKKGFAKVEEVKMKGDGMPRSRDEWEPIMRFWSDHLGRRPIDGLYEVMSGAVPLGA
ncbi:hypothetical protein BC628DRAFT_848418 [Trametes gibbosa]|nr:hypothetical protein BC628DRAFT_848418 [Trametes gibbosa]